MNQSHKRSFIAVLIFIGFLLFMATIKVKQVKSRIKCPKDQKRTLDALGLRKMNQIVEHEANPAILGMVEKVKHLVSVEK